MQPSLGAYTVAWLVAHGSVIELGFMLHDGVHTGACRYFVPLYALKDASVIELTYLLANHCGL